MEVLNINKFAENIRSFVSWFERSFENKICALVGHELPESPERKFINISYWENKPVQIVENYWQEKLNHPIEITREDKIWGFWVTVKVCQKCKTNIIQPPPKSADSASFFNYCLAVK